MKYQSISLLYLSSVRGEFPALFVWMKLNIPPEMREIQDRYSINKNGFKSVFQVERSIFSIFKAIFTWTYYEIHFMQQSPGNIHSCFVKSSKSPLSIFVFLSLM